MGNFLEILEELHNNFPSNSTTYIKELVNEIRPDSRDPEVADKRFNQLIELLEANPELCKSLAAYFKGITSKEPKVVLFTELGINSNEGFFTELRIRVAHALLPPVENRYDPYYLLGEIFSNKKDYRWVRNMRKETWLRFFHILQLEEIHTYPEEAGIVQDVRHSARIISHRIAAIGLEPILLRKLPELHRRKSPFLVQNDEFNLYIHHLKAGKPEAETQTQYRQLLVMLKQCEEYADRIKKNKSRFGTSLALTNLMLRLRQNLTRMQRLLALLQDEKKPYMEREIELLQDLVLLENKKNDLRHFMVNNLSLLTFQVTEHSGNTGSHYITHTFREYSKLLFTALGGGFIVAFFCLFKAALAHLDLAYFGQGVLYSLNYATAFILIYVTHATLATKHPAMTASFIAKTMDQNTKTNVQNLVELLIRLIRSQFIAFIGNIIMAFLVAWLLVETLMYFDLDSPVDHDKATHLIEELSPIRSLALFHAALTGVCLFLSGIIAGLMGNKAHYHNFRRRMIRHPFLRKILPPKKQVQVANYLDRNLGSLTGNLALGIFLGTMASVGHILGIALDVRHITFASGNFGLAAATLPHLSIPVIWHSVVGILLIGFLNFTFSFGLSLSVAFQSRQLKFRETRKVFVELLTQFFRNPFRFFLPEPRPKPEVEIIRDGKVK